MKFQTTAKRKKAAIISTVIAFISTLFAFKSFYHQGALQGTLLFVVTILAILLMGAVIAFKPSFPEGDGLRKKDFNKIYSMSLFFIAPFITLVIVECLNNVALWQLHPLIVLGNYVFYLFLYGIVLAICNRLRLAIIITTSFLFTFGVVNHVVLNLRGAPFVPMDFIALNTALNVASAYRFSVTYNLVISTALFISVIMLTLNVRYKFKDIRKQIIYRGSVLVSAFLIMFTFYQTDIFTNMGLKADLWNQSRGNRNSGAAVNFWLNTKYLFVDEPTAYSADKVESIADDIETVDVAELAENKKPNIIAIMNESFSDLSVVNDFETNEEYLPYWNSLTDNTIRGNLYVSIHGNGTSNSEFEFLTGNTMAFLPAGSNAYELYIKEESQSLVSTLNDQGYISEAIHPYDADGWNRDEVYPLFGFKNFFGIDAFSDSVIYRQYVSDKSSYDKVIERFETKTEDERMFLFNVTMQNHGAYDISYDNFNETICLTKDPLGRTYPKTKQYLSLIKETDNAYKDLIAYFSKVDEPTIIVMFGDHQPKIEPEFYESLYGKSLYELTLEEEMRRYQCPYMIWANFDIEEKELDMSANYLSSVLLETAGLETTPYNEYLLELQQTLPVITAIGYMDDRGNYYSYDEESPYTALLEEYKVLQYNNLFDEENKMEEIFIVEEENDLLLPDNRILR